MSDLFFNEYGAEFSPCRKYRYALWRLWSDKPKVMFVGLNPSTANETDDDPTIRRVKRFAYSWGYGGVYMLNLFPLVTPNPDELLAFYKYPFKHDKEDALNRKWLERTANMVSVSRIIFAWGNFKEAEIRGKTIASILPEAHALAINKNGSPRHPLYVPGNVKPVIFKSKI